jgi:hypothetical protein
MGLFNIKSVPFFSVFVLAIGLSSSFFEATSIAGRKSAYKVPDSASTASFSSEAETRDTHYSDYLPYGGSEWQEQGLIPYEKCYLASLHDSYGFQFDETIGLILFAKNKFREHDRKTGALMVTCYVGKEDYITAIPVDAEGFKNHGLNIEFSEATVGGIRVGFLNGKKVSDLYGTYSGQSAAFALLGLGFKEGTLINSHGITLAYLGYNGSVLTVQLTEQDIHLKQITHSIHSLYSPSETSRIKHASSYRFVHVRKNSWGAYEAMPE